MNPSHSNKNDALYLYPGFSHSPIGGRLRPYPYAREVGLEKVLDEGGLAGGVLPHQHHHRPRVEVGVLQDGGVEVVELVLLLQGEQLLPVGWTETDIRGDFD